MRPAPAWFLLLLGCDPELPKDPLHTGAPEEDPSDDTGEPTTHTGKPEDTAIPEPPGERAGSDAARDTDPDVSAETVATLAADNTAFACDLYHELASPGENLFFSPYSISVAMAMVWAGAAGTTEEQMTETLRLSLPEEDVHAAYNAIDLALHTRGEDVEEGDAFRLSVLNQAWAQPGYDFEPSYLDVLAVHYGAALYLLDFESDPLGARELINAWVAEATNDRIQDILPEDAITAYTRLVVANAIYFRASWATPFERLSSPMSFHGLDGATVEAESMAAELATLYAAGDGWALVEIPYVGEDLDMTLIVPDEGRFEEVEAGLDQPFLADALAAAELHQVQLTMPTFAFGTWADLEEALTTLGMELAFDEFNADFSDLTAPGEWPLYLSHVYHQAFIAVDPEGTEAAAATVAVIDTATDSDSSGPDPVVLDVDRPFVLLVRDRPTGEVLFFGRVLLPGQS